MWVSGIKSCNSPAASSRFKSAVCITFKTIAVGDNDIQLQRVNLPNHKFGLKSNRERKQINRAAVIHWEPRCAAVIHWELRCAKLSYTDDSPSLQLLLPSSALSRPSLIPRLSSPVCLAALLRSMETSRNCLQLLWHIEPQIELYIILSNMRFLFQICPAALSNLTKSAALPKLWDKPGCKAWADKQLQHTQTHRKASGFLKPLGLI